MGTRGERRDWGVRRPAGAGAIAFLGVKGMGVCLRGVLGATTVRGVRGVEGVWGMEICVGAMVADGFDFTSESFESWMFVREAVELAG